MEAQRDDAPVVVAFDGSAEATAAVRAAVTLFGGRRVVVASVWEPGLALAVSPVYNDTGLAYATPSAEQIIEVDRAQREHAAEAAEAGVQIARELGANADAHPVADETDVAATIAALADELDACAVVVGSRGLGRVKSLLGSTSAGLMRHTHRPVLVVRAPE